MRKTPRLIFSISIFVLGLWCPKIASAGEDATYKFKWLDPDKEVYVLQNRKFRKSGKFYTSIGGGITTSGAFADATVMQARAGLFFSEDWGSEFVYNMTNSSTNDTFNSVRAQQAVPFVRQVQGYMGAMLLWSPFYSKINTFNKIFYYDWIFGLGFAKLTEKNNRQELNSVTNPVTVEEEHNGLLWDVGLRLYMSTSWSIKLDLTVVNYKAKKAIASTNEEKIYSNYDFLAALIYTF